MSLPAIHHFLSALFPVDHRDGDVSLQYVETTDEADGYRGLFRLVVWTTNAGGDRGVESIREQPVLLGRPSASLQPMDLAFSVWFAATLVLNSLTTEQAREAMPHEVLGAAPPPGNPAQLRAGVVRARIRSSGRRSPQLVDWEQTIRGERGELTISGLTDVADAWRVRLVHRVPGAERVADVLLLDFPDEQETSRVGAYQAATIGGIAALLSLGPALQQMIPLEDWVAPELLDDPENRTLEDFLGAWVGRPCLVDHVQDVLLQEPTAPPETLGWHRVAAHALLLPGVLAVGDVLQGLGLGPLMARSVVFFPAVLHWFSHSETTAQAARLAHGARAALWLNLVVGAVAVVVLGGVGYPTGADALGVALFAVGIGGISRLS